MQLIQQINMEFADSIYDNLVLRLKTKISNCYISDIKYGKEKYILDITDKEATLLSYDYYSNKFDKILAEFGFKSFALMNQEKLKTNYLVITANLPFKFI